MVCQRFALLLWFVLAGPAYGQTSIAILGVEAVGVPGTLAQHLTESLHQPASKLLGIRLVQGKDLIEMKLIFGCEKETPTCMVQAGKSLGVDKLIYGSVRKVGKGVLTVELRGLDVASGTVERQVSEKLSRKALEASVAALGAKWFTAVLNVPPNPTLAITSIPLGATIAMDGQMVGHTPATLQDLTPGVHTVALSLSGRHSAQRTVELHRGGNYDLAVTLPEEKAAAPLPSRVTLTTPPATPPPIGHPGRVAMVVGGVLLVTAAALGGAAIYTYQQKSELEKPGATSTPCEQQLSEDPKCGEGRRWADTTIGLDIACAALAGAGIITLGVGIHQWHTQRKAAKRTARRTWWLAPAVAPSSAALTAIGQF